MAEYALDTSLAPELARSFDPFTRAYIEAAMWILTDDDGHSCDHLGLHDLDAGAVDRMRADCATFQQTYSALLEGADPSQAGHDFWLTRNGHGAGFWDCDPAMYPADPKGQQLTRASKAEGSADLYLGDDGNVYHY